MRRSHRHQHDLVQRLQQSDPVHDTGTENVKALLRLVNHGLNRLLGHARVMLQFHRLHGRVGTSIAVPHRTNEAADRTDALVTGTQTRNLLRQVEILGLNGNAWNGHGCILAPCAYV